MANNPSLTETYDSLPLLLRIILQLIGGVIVGGIYRIARYLETKNIVTLVVGILALVPPINVVFWILDLYTEITKDRITVLAD